MENGMGFYETERDGHGFHDAERDGDGKRALI